MLKAHCCLNRSEKILAWFALVYGVYMLLLSIPVLVHHLPFVAFATLIYLVIALTSATAGYQGLAAKPWAFWLLFWVFAIQLVDYMSDSYSFSLITPFNMKAGLILQLKPGHIGRLSLNILAVVVCFYSAKAAKSLKHRSTIC